jgi:hypothetical protein
MIGAGAPPLGATGVRPVNRRIGGAQPPEVWNGSALNPAL